jgi:putative protein-disulfide isomerase
MIFVKCSTAFFILFFSLLIMHAQKPAKLIYIGDPMCSWCYGFSEEFSQTMNQLKGQVELQMIMGGLRPYNTESMTDLAAFLKDHWAHVHERSGQPFKYDILADSSFIYDTEPPSRAVRIVRELAPDKEWDFFKAAQKAFYLENKNTHDVQTYLEIAKRMGISTSDFKKAFESEAMKIAVRNDFTTAAELGIRGFPAVVLQLGDRYYLVANGYTTSEVLVQTIKGQLKE